MAAGTGRPVRRGVQKLLTLDHDAVAMLQEIAPTSKSYGRYVSELVRRDYIRKKEWSRRREEQQAIAVVEVGDD